MITALVLVLTHATALAIGAILLWPVSFKFIYSRLMHSCPGLFADFMGTVFDSLGVAYSVEEEYVDKTSHE